MAELQQILTPKQARFVKNLGNPNLNKGEAAVRAGYSPRTASVQASQLLKKTLIIDALDKLGLTDRALARDLKQNIKKGLGVKATADTSLRGIELAFRLKGHLDKPDNVTNNNQTNVFVNELHTMNDEDLQQKLDSLLQDTASVPK